jgi:hypothetical protein
MNRAAKHWVANRIAYHIARLYGLAADFTDGRNNPGFAAYRPQTNRPERGDIALRFEPTDSGHGPSSNRLAFGGFVASGSLGVAAFDVRNADHDDDNGTTAAFLARGVFSSGDLSRNYDGSPPNANGIFRASFDPLSPFSASGAPRGTPLGEHPDDPFICDPNQNPATFSGARLTRYLNVLRAMDTLAARLASTAAHEIGHSLGLDR